MLRVVADPGVLISALISPNGTPAALVRRWLAGETQFICSPALIGEFSDVTARPRFRSWFTAQEAVMFARLLTDIAEWHEDRPVGEPAPSDPKDAYLVALALTANADCLVTGDAALAGHRTAIRIVSPRYALDILDKISATEPD